MKKVFMLLAAVACLAVSCKKEVKGPVLTPEQNKTTLDETMTKAVEMLSVENWQETADLITASAVALDDKAADQSVESWIEGIEKGWMSKQGDVEIMTVNLEDLQGTLTVGDSVSVAAGKGLSLNYNLEDGSKVEAKMSVKNSKTTVLLGEDYTYYDAAGQYVEDGILRGKEYLIVPALLEANVNAAGKKAANVKITTDLSIAGEQPTVNDKLSATATVSAGSYTFAVTRAKYSNTEVAVDASIKYGKNTVVSAKLEAKGKIVGEGEDIDPFSSTGKVNASFSVLDNVVLKGSFDWTAYMELSAKEHSDTEEGVKADCAALEKIANLTLYIQNTAQAKLGFEAIEHTDVEVSYWSIVPVVRFEDGSQYALPEEFFNPEGFPKTVEAVNKALAEMEEFLSGPESEK